MAQLAEIQQRLARATSLLVVLRDRLPDDAHAALSLARQRGIAVDAIFHRFRDGDYLDALHREGVGLFEGALPPGDGSQLFIDCEVGYELPGWLPIEAAGSLAYQLLWRRIGVAIEVEGEVKKRAADDTLLELVAARPTFVDLRRLAAKPRLEEGAKAVVLGVVAFIGIRGAALLVDALRVEQRLRLTVCAVLPHISQTPFSTTRSLAFLYPVPMSLASATDCSAKVNPAARARQSTQ